MKQATSVGLVWMAAGALAACAAAPPPPPGPEFVPAQALVAGDAGTAAVPAASATASVDAPATPPRPKATGTPEDARRHLVRGAAAIEMARGNEGLVEAVEEFTIATEIAPDMAAAWFNLGAVQAKLGRADAAMAAYRQYLVLSPEAADARQVADEIIKLEYRQEKGRAEQAAAGTWIEADGTAYTLAVEGDKLVLRTTARPLDPEIDEFYGPGLGALPFPTAGEETLTFRLVERGGRLGGHWDRAEVEIDVCTVPAETGEVQGEMDRANNRLVLEFTKSRYKVFVAEPPILSFSTQKTCREMKVVDRSKRTFVFRGPLPAGRVGMEVTTAHGMMGTRDWIGELRVVNVLNNSPAQRAGVQARDLIVAIDGVPVKSLTAGEAMYRLFGTPGSPLALTVLHHKADQPVTVQMTRQ